MIRLEWLGKRKKSFFDGLAIVVLIYFQIAYLFLSLAAFQPRIAINTVQMIRVVLSRDVIGTPELLLVVNSFGPCIGFLLIAAVLRGITAGKKWVKFFAFLVTGTYVLNAILLAARVVMGDVPDSFLLWHNLGDSYRTLVVFINGDKLLFGLGLAVILLHYQGLLRLSAAVLKATGQQQTGELKLGFSAFSGVGLLIVLCGQLYAGNGLFNLLLEVRQPQSGARTLYQRYFQDSVERNSRHVFRPPAKGADENLFVFQLESLNADLVNEFITPRLVEVAAENGVLFPRIQAASVLTILSMETILCSTLPTLADNLAQSAKLSSRLACLPAVMKQLGYRTLYFQNYPDLSFHNMQSFFKAIGFDELHSADIMKPGDQRLAWGYREDIFYKRVFAYLRSLPRGKVFAYILVGATNHYPFYGDETKAVYPEYLQKLPFPSPVSLKERMANTTYLQDYFFGQMYREEFAKDYRENSHAVVLGDHSSPIEEHPGNSFFLSGAYQENFVTSMAVLPAKNSANQKSYAVGKKVHTVYSYLDVLPTILGMHGIGVHAYYGTSFLDELQANTQKTNNRCIVSVQPFSGGAISIINYPIKHVFNLRRGLVSVYDLEADPNEIKKIKESKMDEAATGMLDACLTSLKKLNSQSMN